MVTVRQRWALVLVMVALMSFGLLAQPSKDHRLGKWPTFQIRQWTDSVAFAPDGKTVACDLVVRDTADGKERAIGKPGEEHAGCTYVAFSPDGKRLASVHYDRGLIHARHALCLWDVSTLSQVRKVATLFVAKGEVNPYAESLHYLTFSSDGKLLASRHLNDSTIVWDTTTCKERVRLKTNGLAVAFSRDGRKLISVSRTGLVQDWDLVTGKCADRPGGPTRDSYSYVKEAIASADGTTLALTDGHTVVLHDARTGKRLRHFVNLDDSGCLALSSDGRYLATACRTGVVLFDALTGKERGRWVDESRRKGHTSTIRALAFSPEGKSLVVVGGEEGTTSWDVETLARPKKPEANPKRNPAVSLETTVVSLAENYRLDLGGKSLSEYLRHFDVGQELPPSPKVDLLLNIRNRSETPFVLDTDGRFYSYLAGDGAVNDPGLPYQIGIVGGMPPPKTVSIAPGETYSIPLQSLEHDYHQGSYWMLPGEYTLHVSYFTRVNPAPEGWRLLEDGSGSGLLQAAPLRLKVVK